MRRWARVPYADEVEKRVEDLEAGSSETSIAAGSDFSVVHGLRAGETRTWICGNLDHKSSRFSTCVSHELRELLPLRGVRINSLACGRAHAVLTTEEGDVWSFGWNMYGQLGLGLQYDHTRTPQLLESLRGPKLQDVACGGQHAVVMLSDGSLFAWGRNEEGQLAIGSLEPKLIPSRVETPWRGEERVVQLACGFSHTAFLTSSGRVFCSGQGDSGQLGIGSKSNSLVPALVLGIERAHVGSLVCGHSHTMVVDANAQMAFSWGSNATGELGHASCEVEFQLLPKLMLEDLKEVRLSAVGCGPCARHTLLACRQRMPWRLERLLWIGVLKCEASQCLLALLPRDGIASCPILIHILRLLPLRFFL
ncbi:hypothetical protein GUITHDRAFT_71654 [Guillardia theta CCMP2712]|uniref:RCC1-like domain-containing protein n=1 Tax=Guillardia theta (strain CCMP2712) TaxID=905079 RepID=L1J917_GUITC|nr:hypothetical protein GUITHDRAFT_71654 [Guillardia theta CCMP2712]EKX45021.1 hypothetical protein GUITHDRAFT_71654 [Guillardia theta CCMP2712]|eukprot:XP_005832001.1 hypothetical protein GUITHDRAFT_71654 [Guillardia theta CCMP2712]